MTNRSGYEQISSVGGVWLAASFCTASCIGVATVEMSDVGGNERHRASPHNSPEWAFDVETAANNACAPDIRKSFDVMHGRTPECLELHVTRLW
ncbi:hypothetical protein G5I_11597 [Acromyrmex echinatior]|uniref:Uncharacterized protein n=1 Tax=Acromyrmex echinatior TaxID=103372 RepID=F4X015_ACREC|nr:hypothetical protein G5I_11597 [Acromyrmex echinatior]